MIPSFTHLRYWMNMRVITAWMTLTAMLVLLWIGFPGVACADEQGRQFLESLRDARYHDMAMHYLDQMEDRRDIPSDLKEVLDYERAITLLGYPVTSRSERKENLSKASSRLRSFLTKHPKHKYDTQARNHLANVLIEQGQMGIRASEQPGIDAKEKAKLIQQARRFYHQAKDVFEDQDKRLAAQLKALPEEPKNAAEEKRLEALRGEYLQTRLSLATADYEEGLTYSPKSRRYKSLIRGAAKQYRELYDKYKTRGVRLYARLWEGRCYQKLGDSKQAIEAFESILMQLDDTLPSRRLKSKTIALYMETLINPKVKRYADALDLYQNWAKGRLSTENSSPEGLELHYLEGVTSLRWARSLKASNKKRPGLLADARKAFHFVLRFPGETQACAREKLDDKLLVTGEEKEREPRDFADAMGLGHDQLKEIKLAKQIAELSAKGSKNKSSDEELQRAVRSKERKAIRYFKKALRLAEPDTPIERVKEARYCVNEACYYLAYLLMKQDRPYDAVVFADYLARRFPEGGYGCSTAGIALAIFVEMGMDPTASPDMKAFAARRTEEMAKYIITMWPTRKEATDARKIFIHTALRNNNIKEAVEMVNAIPQKAEGRGALLMLVGRVIYADYVRLLNQHKKSAKEKTPKKSKVEQAKLDRLLSQAKTMLEDGLELSRKELREVARKDTRKVDRSFLAGELTLARIYLSEGSIKRAESLVRYRYTGLLAIAHKPDPEIAKDGLDLEVYKTSLRILVAAQNRKDVSEKKRKRNRKLIDDVRKALESRMKKAGGRDGGEQFVQIYLGLAQGFKQDLEALREAGKTKEAAKVQKDLEESLNQVVGYVESASFNVMYWLAVTYSDLAESIEKEADKPLSPKAKQCYEKSVEIYEQILSRCVKEKGFAPSAGMVDAIRIRLAISLRKLGRYEDALKQLYTVLKDRNTMVNAQVEAAATYEAWAGTKGKARLYLNAMFGGVSRMEDGKKTYVIWGWAKLSKRLAGNKKYRALFHETRYNLLVCRYGYAMSDVCKDRAKYLTDIVRDYRIISKLYPKMGGKAMKQKYDRLYAKVPQKYKPTKHK